LKSQIQTSELSSENFLENFVFGSAPKNSFDRETTLYEKKILKIVHPLKIEIKNMNSSSSAHEQ